MKGELAFGITAAPRDGTERLGPAIEALGYAELWANDTRRGAGLETLAVTASGTQRLRFGVGVIGLSERGPRSIAVEQRDAVAAGLPADRLTLGVGSGSSRSLALVREGVAELRSLLPGQQVAVAAVQRRMCELAGEIADTVLLNWSLPGRLVEQRGWVAEGAARAGRDVPQLSAYVRVAVGPGADGRLRNEMERYARRSAAYARTFASQDELVGVAVAEAAGLRAALLPYRAVLDCCVVRGLPEGDRIGDWLAVAEAAAG